MPWSGCQHGQICVWLNFRANWAFSAGELHLHHNSDTQSALLMQVAGLGCGKTPKPQSEASPGDRRVIRYLLPSLPQDRATSLGGNFYDNTSHLKVFGSMLSGLVQPTGNTASLIELEHIWRDRAHPADSDTALSSLHFFLKDQEPRS